MKTFFSTILTALAFILSACGGSGSGTSTPTGVSYTGPTAAITLNAANTTSVSGAAVDTVSGAFLADVPLPLGVESSPSQAKYNLLEISKSMALTVLEANNNLNTIMVIGAEATYVCDGAVGTLTIITDASGYNLTATYNNCSVGGIIANGSMSIGITAINGTIGDTFSPWDVSFTMTYGVFSIDNGALVIDGDCSYILGDDLTDTNLTFSGTSLYVAAGSEQALLSNYSFSSTVNNSTYLHTSDSNFTYTGTDIGGSITVETTTPFKTTYGASYPYQGSGTIMGAGGTKIRLTAANSTQVLLEWDIDPIDGDYEGNQLYLWTDL
jgi:hypothetical protein